MDRTVIITGAAGRLGSRMMAGFRASGYAVAGVGHGSDYEADLTVEDAVAQVFDTIVKHHGPIFALIHTVGMWQARPLADSSVQDWELMMRVNLTSTFLCFREAARWMQTGDGRLIAVTSSQGADRARAKQAAYAASKAGIIRLVEAAAREYQGRGISSHALAPSVITFGDPGAAGVPASALVQAALFLCSAAGKSASGDTMRFYGSELS